MLQFALQTACRSAKNGAGFPQSSKSQIVSACEPSLLNISDALTRYVQRSSAYMYVVPNATIAHMSYEGPSVRQHQTCKLLEAGMLYLYVEV